jgi:hypothetical protein
VFWFIVPAIFVKISDQATPAVAEEFADRTYPFAPTGRRTMVLDAEAASKSPFAVAMFIPKRFVVAVGSVSVPVFVMVEIVGLVRVRPAKVVVVAPNVSAVDPRVSPGLANLALVTLASTILAVVTVPSVGVRVLVRRVSVP